MVVEEEMDELGGQSARELRRVDPRGRRICTPSGVRTLAMVGRGFDLGSWTIQRELLLSWSSASRAHVLVYSFSVLYYGRSSGPGWVNGQSRRPLRRPRRRGVVLGGDVAGLYWVRG